MYDVSAKRVQPSTDGYNVTMVCPFCGKDEEHGNVRDGEVRIARCAVADVPEGNGYRIHILQVAGGV